MQPGTATSPNEELPSKSSLRTQIRTVLKQMPAEKRAADSALLCSKLEQQPVWQKAQSILFFAPLAEEPDLWPLVKSALAAGRTVALPRFVAEEKIYAPYQVRDLERDVITGQFGIREPRDSCPKIPLNRLDLILVPGVAFDFDGHRLGRGKGYYDRMLGQFEGPACGVAFDEQIVARIPVEPHDVRLSCILTPTRWHHVAGPRAV